MPQDSAPNRVAREPEDMNSGVLDTLRGALLLTPPGRALEMSQLLQSLRDMADQQLVIESADMLGIGLTDPMDIHVASVHAHTRFHGTTIFHPLKSIPTSGLAREAALGAVADTERANPGLYNQMMRGDQTATQQFQDAVDAAVANPQARNVTPPVQAEVTAENVRVTGGCRPIRICFWPGRNFRNNPNLRREYDQQLRQQQDGLNAMAPGQVVSNRQAYCALPSTSRGIAGPSQAAARRLYRANYTRRLERVERALPARARAIANVTRTTRVARHMRDVAALHNPDRIAGGSSTVVYGPSDAAATLAGRPATTIGHRGTNSSIGRLWGGCNDPSSNSSRLQDHAERQAAAGCSSVQATLAICRD